MRESTASVSSGSIIQVKEFFSWMMPGPLHRSFARQGPLDVTHLLKHFTWVALAWWWVHGDNNLPPTLSSLPKASFTRLKPLIPSIPCFCDWKTTTVTHIANLKRISLTRISRVTGTCHWSVEAPPACRAPRGKRRVSPEPPQVRGPRAAGSGFSVSSLPPRSARPRHSTGSSCTSRPERGGVQRWESVDGWTDRRKSDGGSRQRSVRSARFVRASASLTCFTSILCLSILSLTVNKRFRLAVILTPCWRFYLSVSLGKTGGMRK